MTRHRALSVLALALLVTPLFTLPAQAGQFHFSVGAGFRIGGLHFNLVLGHSDHHHGYYFRTADPFSYGHLSCSDRCFRDGGYTYHDRSCPLVRHHLDRYHVDGRWLFDRYAPSDAYYDDENGRGSYYGDDDTDYDGRYDGRYDGYYQRDGYHSRDGYRRHRHSHHGSCPGYRY
ncbi:MAG: hypothetical protein U0002_08790 [Thermoanaerobaculia bacterium]